MKPDKPICVVGSIVYDFVMNLPRFPEPGETVLGNRFATFIGGKGLNQAMQIHRLGAPLTFWGRVGDDKLGCEVFEVLENQSFSTSGIRTIPGDQTATGMIYVVPGGMNMIGGIPTANMNFTVDEIDERTQKAIRDASIVSLQLEIPDEVNLRVLQLAKDAGVPTVLNAAPWHNIPVSIREMVDYWVVNEIEAGQFFDCRIVNYQDCEPMRAHPAISSGRQLWVVTLGERGAALVDSSGVSEIPGIPVEAVDSTGAGDSFTGGFVVGLAEGLSPLDAAYFANKVAALSVTKLGGMSGLPFRSEVK
jgi:ribokinase